MKRTFLESISVSLVWIGVSLLNPTIAFANGANAPEPAMTQQESEAPMLPAKYIADGNLMEIEALGLAVAGPKGWSVSFNNGAGPSVIMEEPKVEVSRKIKKSVTTYQRNITLSIKHEGAPIDEKRAALLAEQLTNQFSKKSITANYSILETKMVDLADGKKAVMAYASFTMNNVDMMQMHILTANDNSQYLQTYTDMAKRFSPEDSGFAQAWESMTSMQIAGEAPVRYQDLIQVAAVSGGVLFLFLLLTVVRRRKKKSAFERSITDLETGEYSEDSSMVSTNWAFDRSSNDDEQEFVFGDELPVTQVSPLDSAWTVPTKTRISPAAFSSHV